MSAWLRVGSTRRWPNEGDANGEPVTTFWKTEPKIDPRAFASPRSILPTSTQGTSNQVKLVPVMPARLRLHLDARLPGNDTLIEFDPLERVPI
jgi:hypothetical protein